MAQGNYGPEIKASMQKKQPVESKAEDRRDKQRGIAEGTKRDVADDAPMPMRGGAPPDAHHVAAAASIAHAILGRRGM